MQHEARRAAARSARQGRPRADSIVNAPSNARKMSASIVFHRNDTES